MEGNKSEVSNQLLVRQEGMVIPAAMHTMLLSLEATEQWAQKMAKQEDAIPKHLVGKPDLIVTVVMDGLSRGMDPFKAIQSLVPTNGVVTMKGDAALSRVRASGLLEKWEVHKKGSIEEENYEVTIVGRRKGSSVDFIESYSVDIAKRNGLWVTQEAVSKNYKLGYKPWYKFPDRMIYYRALGYIMRDHFGDVVEGPIQEEAQDYLDIDHEEILKGKNTLKSDKAIEATINTVKGIVDKPKDEAVKAEAKEEVLEVEFEEIEPGQEQTKKEEQEQQPKEEPSKAIMYSLSKSESIIEVQTIAASPECTAPILAKAYEERFGVISMGDQKRKTTNFMLSKWEEAFDDSEEEIEEEHDSDKAEAELAQATGVTDSSAEETSETASDKSNMEFPEELTDPEFDIDPDTKKRARLVKFALSDALFEFGYDPVKLTSLMAKNKSFEGLTIEDLYESVPSDKIRKLIAESN